MGPDGRLVVCDSGHESQMRKENELVDEKAASLGEMWEEDLISDVLQKRSSRKKGSYSKPWTPAENEKFFNMLRDHGTDFQMMEEMFSDRSRLELKRKFKREEKTWKREPGRGSLDLKLGNLKILTFRQRRCAAWVRLKQRRKGLDQGGDTRTKVFTRVAPMMIVLLKKSQ